MKILFGHDKTGYWFEARFILENTFITERWVRCLQDALKNYELSERHAFYNLNDEWPVERCVQEINERIQYCNGFERLFTREVRDPNDQDTLNQIHAVFEEHHGKLDQWKTNPLFQDKPSMFRQALSEINQLVHRMEGSSKKIRCTWFDRPKKETYGEHDYQYFTNTRNFGGVYILYADVGKNLESLAIDNDEHHLDFVPNLHFSADFEICFSPRSDAEARPLVEQQDKFFERHRHYFESKGYYKGDPRLTTGAVQVAHMVRKSGTDEQDILDHLSKCNTVVDIRL